MTRTHLSQLARRLWLPAYAILLSLSLLTASGCACAQPNAPFPRRVTDAAGQSVSIPARPHSVAVVGDDPAATAVIAAVDRRTLDPVRDDPAAFPWKTTGLLLIAKPYAAAYPAWIAAAQAASVPVIQTAPVISLANWQAAIRLIGVASGRDDQAAAVQRRLAWQIAAARLVGRIVGGVTGHREPVRALVLTPEGYTFGRGTLITDLISTAGGVNVAAAAGYDTFRQIDDTAIRDLAPDVILLSPAWHAGDRAAFLAAPVYAGVPAVRTGRVFRLPFSPTLPRNPGAALVSLALLLHW